MIIEKLVKNAVREQVRKYRPKASDDRPKAALIFGAGALPGIGAAVAQRCVEGGLQVYIAGRNEDKLAATAKAIGNNITPIVVDANDEKQIKAAFKQVADDGYALDLVVHNVGTNRPAKFMDLTIEQLEKGWRADCLSGFYVGQQAVEAMQPNQRGTVIFTGASASLRGKDGFAGFAMAKAGLRIMAQSMARDFGPKGIHVVHAVIDGMVDGERLRGFMPALLDQMGEDGTLNPAAIAETYWQVYQQHRSAWTHELDLRPFKENW